jgi:hypothetical protein
MPARFPVVAVALLVFFSASPEVRALIIYGVDNSGNTSDPGAGNAWDSVVEVATPTQAHNASAVYLGNGYFLTAKHVDAIVPKQEVKINGGNFTLDTGFGTEGIQLVEDLPGVAGPVDLKLFRIESRPVLAAIGLNSTTNDLSKSSYMIGWGKGKGTAITDQGWNWGDTSTISKRWGTTETNSTTTDGMLRSEFKTSYGANSASLTLGDSGSGLFQNQGGTWVLAGMSVDVETGDASYYNKGAADPANPDWSGYVRVSTYASAIQTAIPEPGPAGLVLLGLAVAFACAGRKKPRAFPL